MTDHYENRTAIRVFSTILLAASACSGSESNNKALIRLLNGMLGGDRAQISAGFSKGQMTKSSTGQPAWFVEEDAIFMPITGRLPSRSVQTTTQVDPGESKTINFGDGNVVTKTEPGTVRTTTVIQDDPGRPSSAYYLHPGIMFCFDANGRVYKWEVWEYPSRGPTPTELERAHSNQLWHIVDAWELRADKKGRTKPVHVMKGGRIWWLGN